MIKKLFTVRSSDQEVFQMVDKATQRSDLKLSHRFFDKISRDQGHMIKLISLIKNFDPSRTWLYKSYVSDYPLLIVTQ